MKMTHKLLPFCAALVFATGVSSAASNFVQVQIAPPATTASVNLAGLQSSGQVGSQLYVFCELYEAGGFTDAAPVPAPGTVNVGLTLGAEGMIFTLKAEANVSSNADAFLKEIGVPSGVSEIVVTYKPSNDASLQLYNKNGLMCRFSYQPIN